MGQLDTSYGAVGSEEMALLAYMDLVAEAQRILAATQQPRPEGISDAEAVEQLIVLFDGPVATGALQMAKVALGRATAADFTEPGSAPN
ncbi:hypothetical protein IS481_06430 [Caldimonas thermodepolymerans]|jgi:hypothetical protein|uniref:Uncharacterized protein n=1 Tax=Caldimonas thermodepolymerans TaxID=215580 RepID=A0A2S5T372_9BURK|nr:hypothetical protein [Caldimonas thermodepolymerans]PPE69433.1 hypothetical protein C1702_12095 [Caldimonas thermodepolymerans]QPC32784.1 hypothetical protein IS481_06430 [Caldimonas thermodepolymerans]RDI03551.1 hypothetical protein DES46_101233 [Caldimonas thermodepolymerans]TCP09461.1 hypothetical protein EV676_10134 [Caldimonas thermodepolymerans]UZG45650.1 hypothetical protein ONZ46_06785 [Caldimonas thermodepolymerans]